MTECGRTSCLGRSCGNFGERGCRGVDWSVPPFGYARWYLTELQRILTHGATGAILNDNARDENNASK